MNVRRINLYGPAGSGKSTLAARIYADLKAQGIGIELITEVIKPWAYEGRVPQGFDQIHLFGKQLRREELFLRHGVPLVVTDSPLLLNCAYAEYTGTPGRHGQMDIALAFEDKYPSLHLYLQRSFAYQGTGRYQQESEAREFEEFLKGFLSRWMVPTLDVDPKEMVDNSKWLTQQLGLLT